MPSACNVLGFSWVYWCGRLQENDPKALLHNTGEIFTSCWPNHRKPKWSPLQSCPPVTHLEQAYAKAYTPRKNITVDDGLEIKWKAFLQAVHANEAWKIWHQSLASCWCWHICSTVPQFQVYLSQNQTNSELFQGKGLCYYVVWTLGEPHINNNWHFFLDTFFSSADLMWDFEARNMYTCGTVRTTKKDYPSDLKWMKLVQDEVKITESISLDPWEANPQEATQTWLSLRISKASYCRLLWI